MIHFYNNQTGCVVAHDNMRGNNQLIVHSFFPAVLTLFSFFFEWTRLVGASFAIRFLFYIWVLILIENVHAIPSHRVRVKRARGRTALSWAHHTRAVVVMMIAAASVCLVSSISFLTINSHYVFSYLRDRSFHTEVSVFVSVHWTYIWETSMFAILLLLPLL